MSLFRLCKGIKSNVSRTASSDYLYSLRFSRFLCDAHSLGFATVKPEEISGSQPAEVQNLVQGKWMKTTNLNTIKDPLNGEKFITVTEVDESGIKPFVESLSKCPKHGLHNPFKSPERYLLYGDISAKAGHMLSQPEVYFMDTQIWYSVFCAIFGGLYGILHHLGEIRTLGMMRSRFQDLPLAFMNSLIPHPTKTEKHLKRKSFLREMFQKLSERQMRNGLVKFIVVWNEIIKSFREEDLLSNREVELMKMPLSSELLSGLVRWPIFLLANQLPMALTVARDFVGEDANLFKRIRADIYMYITVNECYESLKYILDILIVGDLERRVIHGIIEEIEESIRKSTFVKDFDRTEILSLHAKCIELVELLVEGNENNYPKVVKVLQDVLEIVTNDMMKNGSRTMDSVNAYQQTEGSYFDDVEPDPQLFASRHSVHFPLPDSDSLKKKIKRFLLLLTVKDAAMDIPKNLGARRRISFFATSLFMDIPRAPKVRNMLSFSVLTPHLKEEVKFSTKELNEDQDYVSIGFYLQKIFLDELENFLE